MIRTNTPIMRANAFRSCVSFAMLWCALSPNTVNAELEIHRCTLSDGTIAFQETPCAENVAVPEEDAVDPISHSPDDDFDFSSPFDEPAPLVQVETATPSTATPSLDRSDCEKTTRDAIDAIDLDMRNTAYSEAEGKEFLAELLVLTKQLRDCKQL